MRKGGDVQNSNLKGFKALLEHFAELYADLGILGTDGADIIVRKIFKLRSCFYASVRFPAFFIIHIRTDGAYVSGWAPSLKTPFANLAFALVPTDRAYVGIGKSLKCGARRYAIMRLSPQW